MVPNLYFFPGAAASLDMTADFAPLLFGLLGLLIVSTVSIALSAVLPWIRQRRAITGTAASSSSGLTPGVSAPALSPR